MHKYTSSIDYIDNLTFDHVETFSFQRGQEFESTIQTIRPEYDKLKVRKDKANNLTLEETKRFEELHSLLGFTQYILDDKGQFHPSSVKKNTFKSSSPQIARLKEILHTKINDVPAWMCAPFYRDAIVFYDQANKIISTLNVCLSCEYMETQMHNHINGDEKTYKLLRQFFVDIGHPVEGKATDAST